MMKKRWKWWRCHVGGSCDGGIVGSSLAARDFGKKKTKNRRAPAELNEAPASLELVRVYI
jgi:hypothetical protein